MKLKYLTALVLFAIVFLLLFKYYRADKHGTDIDRLDTLLAPVKKIISPTSVIGFCTNVPDDRVNELYFKTTLVMAPAIVEKTPEADTVLYVQHVQFPLKQPGNYECVMKGSDGEVAYFLMALKK